MLIMSEWIDTARKARLRGYIKMGDNVKERYVGKYGIGVRIKSHLNTSFYLEVIRTVQDDSQWFCATFERDRINQPPESRTITVLNIVKKNDGYHCKLGDGATLNFTNDWKVVECDVWEVIGV